MPAPESILKMRILIASGASGGHIFPALALMDSLKKNGAIVFLVLPQKSKHGSIPVECGNVEYITAASLDFSLSSSNLSGAYSFLKGAWEGLRIMMKFRPDVVVGFGSLHTVALLFWAWLFRIKTVIHEQNVIPGMANRLIAKFADSLAISFPQTRSYFSESRERVILTGNPIRKELIKLNKKEALNFFKFEEGKFNILIVGGSQGSHKINAVSFAALTALPRKEDLQIIHISGVQDFAGLKAGYAVSGMTHKLFDFFPAMQYAYSAADLAICRAGATTIAELQKFSLPAVLVPYPYAGAHQASNARVLEDIGAAEVIFDADLAVEKLKDKLQEFFYDSQKLRLMRQAYQKLPVLDAAEIFAKEVLTLG